MQISTKTTEQCLSFGIQIEKDLLGPRAYAGITSCYQPKEGIVFNVIDADGDQMLAVEYSRKLIA